VRAGTRTGRVTSKKLKSKSKMSKSKKAAGARRKTAKRPAGFKSDSWYVNAMLSIGVKARGEPRAN
jgi:hypothetical protein